MPRVPSSKASKQTKQAKRANHAKQAKQARQANEYAPVSKVCSEHHLQGRATIARAKMTAEKMILHMYETDMYAYMYARSRARASASESQGKWQQGQDLH